MTPCVQRADEELTQRRVSRDLVLNRKRKEAMEKKESIMRKKRVELRMNGGGPNGEFEDISD